MFEFFDFINHKSFQFPILANLSPDVVKNLPDELQTGIYFGWANVDNGEIYKAVLSLGWNPFFKNKEKSLVSANANGMNRLLLIVKSLIGY